MRRFIVLICAACLLLGVSACAKQTPAQSEPITLFPPRSEQSSADTVDSSSQQWVQLVNKTYGQKKADVQMHVVKDISATYRTQDSYDLEPNALSAAKAFFAKTITMPDTLTVSNAQVLDCADTGKSVFYRIFIEASYQVETGETIQRTTFMDVGVHKSDQTAFDASDEMRDVLRAYSVFSDSVLNLSVQTTDFADAATQIALSQLKQTDAGKVVQSFRRDDLCDEPRLSVYDVVCTGINDYGMEIPCNYTVYMTWDGGQIRQLDPAETDF